jgi:hypothetical protein
VSGGIAQLFFNLSIEKGCVVSITPRPPLLPGKTRDPLHYAMVFITINAVHVLGGSSAHHQELKTIHSVRYLSSFFCFLSLSWVESTHDSGKKQKKLDKYRTLCIQF